MNGPLLGWTLVVQAQIGGTDQTYGSARYGFGIYMGQQSPWVNLECQITDLRIGRGLQRDRGVIVRPVAGSCSLRGHDPDGRLDPSNPSSPYAGRLRVGVPARIVAVRDSDSLVRPLFTGRARRWSWKGPDEASVDLDDVTSLLASWPIESPRPAESTAARLDAILDLVPWAVQRDLQGTGALLAAATVDGRAWDALLDTVLNDLSLLWVAADETIRWRDYTLAWQWPPRPYPTLLCHPDPAQPNVVPYDELSSDCDDAILVNEATARRKDGAGTVIGEATIADTASRLAHGPVGFSTDLDLPSNEALAAWVGQQVGRAAWPRPRLSSLQVTSMDSVSPAHRPAIADLVTSIDLGDYLTVRRHDGSGQHVRVHAIDHQVTHHVWRTTYQLGQPWDETQSVYGLARYGTAIYEGAPA